MSSVPNTMQPIFWSTDPQKLDLNSNKQYIIHQVLQFGDVEDFDWLKQQYSLEQIISTFISNPSRVYSSRSFYFVKNYLLQISGEELDEEAYVNTL